MIKLKKILLFIMILVSLNLTKVPVEVKASGRLGVNLFSNPGFEETGKFNFAPLIVKYNSANRANVFAKGEIVDGVGVGGSRALEAELMPTCSGKIYGTFAVNPRSTYRLSAAGRRVEDDDNPMHIGVSGYDETIKNSEAISGKFDTLEYQYKEVYFVIGKETTEVEIFIYYPKPKIFYQTGGYIDDLVIEELTYPPTIDPIYDPAIADSITGTGEPGMEVKITLRNDTHTVQVKEDGTFILPVTLGSLNEGEPITAIQVGVDGVESIPETSTVAEKRLGKDLFPNPGFELPDDSNYSPFVIPFKSSFGVEGFKEGIIKSKGAYNGKRALYLVINSGAWKDAEVEGVFNVNARSKYRISAYGYLGDESEDKDKRSKPSYLGVRGHENGSGDDTSGKFEKHNQYEYRYKDFLVNGTEKVTVYIHVPTAAVPPLGAYYGYLRIDDFVIEEIAYPPSIDPIDNASAATVITGTSEPGTKVKVVLSPGGTKLEGVTGYDGTYSIPISSGDLRNITGMAAYQYGIDDIESQPATIVVTDTIAPPAPSINVVRDEDEEITGKSEPHSEVIITFKNEDEKSIFADKDGKYSLLISSGILISGDLIKAKAKDAAGNISEITTTEIMATSTTTVDLDKGIAIYGENFTWEASKLSELTQEEVLSKSKARAFKIDDEERLPLEISVNSSLLRDEVDKYEVFLEVEGVNRSIYVIITDSNSTVSKENDLVTYAKGFSVKQGDALKLTRSDVIKSSELKAWRLSDGSDLEKALTIDTSQLEQKKGTYKVEFKIGETVVHTIRVTVLEKDTTPPEIYDHEVLSPIGYNSCKWSNGDIIVKLLVRDNTKVDHTSYEISTNSGTTWTTNGLSDQTVNSVTLTITSEQQYENILVRVKDTEGNLRTHILTKRLSINIDRTSPTCNYTSKTYSSEELDKIIFEDSLSGVFSAKLDDKDIISDLIVPEGEGDHNLVIIDNAGNILKINFTISSS